MANGSRFHSLAWAALALSACSDGDGAVENNDAVALPPAGDVASGSETSSESDAPESPGPDSVAPNDIPVSGDLGDSSAITYHATVRAIIESACSGCHVDEGIGPFPLDSFERLTGAASAVKQAVGDERMPPWPPNEACREMRDPRVLSEADKSALLGFLDGDMPEGNPADFVPRTKDAPDLGEANLVLDAGVDYAPNPLFPDDYRCLTLDYVFAKRTYITALDVLPGQRSMVHHVLLYPATPDDVSDLDTLAKEDAAPGYTCFGGPRAGSGQTLGGWVPGSVGFVLPTGYALEIAAGARIIMQIHYNTAGAGASPPPDRTKILLWTLPESSKPTHLVDIFPFANGEIAISAGDAKSVQTKTFEVPIPGTIIGTVPHMHMLGRSITMEVTKGDAAPECLVDVPDWDFNWQQFYLYDESGYRAVVPGETLTLTCTYDNSAANQPFVNGEQLAPRDVAWGEGTHDEMCLDYLIVRRPYLPDDGSTVCPGFEPCVRDCAEGDEQCLIECAFYAGVECIQCALPELLPCAQEQCPLPSLALLGCLNGCSDSVACLLTTCRSEFHGLWTCLEPSLEAGICDPALTKCDVSFAP